MSDVPVYPNRAKALRERLLSLRVPENKKVDLVLDGGEVIPVWIRTALTKDRDEVGAVAINNSPLVMEDGKKRKPRLDEMSSDRMLAAALIVLAVDEVGTPIFQEADFESLRGIKAGGELERFATDIVKTLSPPSAKDADPKT